MGEGRYQTLLCLVQVAVETDAPGGDVRIEVLDPLDDRARPRAARRRARRSRRSRSSCTPAARTSRCCAASARRSITNLFDTQLAAGFAGLRAQLGYEALLHELLGVRLQKSASFTRWDARPLSAEQIDYARDDVRHILQATTRAAGSACARAGAWTGRARSASRWPSATDERDPDTIFARLPRVNSLDPKLRAIARELVVWREETARAQDRPIPSVLSDAGARRGRQAPAEPDDPARADPRHQRVDAAPPRARDPRGRRARAAAARRSPSRASARRSPTRSTRR